MHYTIVLCSVTTYVSFEWSEEFNLATLHYSLNNKPSFSDECQHHKNLPFILLAFYLMKVPLLLLSLQLYILISFNPIYDVSVDHHHKLRYCWTQTLWIAKILPKRKYFEKKDCFTQDSNLGPQKLLFFDLPTFH